VLLCRVSTDSQEREGNLRDLMWEAIRTLVEIGFRMGRDLFVFEGVESGQIQKDRPLLGQAIDEAQRKDAILVAPSRDRLIRSRSFDGSNETEAPTIAEYMQLQQMAGEVPLATLHDPDQPARSEQIKRGQAAKGNRGGRPRKRKWKARRLARIGLARKMREEGKSYRQITRSLNARNVGFSDVMPKTVWNWLQRDV
jgi:DNA invertase Pin-like site-specific DNA recombinase